MAVGAQILGRKFEASRIVDGEAAHVLATLADDRFIIQRP